MIETKTSFTWTPCQQRAINEIVEWSFRPDELFHSLAGSAGTGKSTVVSEILNHVKQQYGVCVSAPTHKAKDVISQITGQDSYTVQKLLGLRPNFDIDNFDIHKLKFEKSNKPAIKDYSLIIIDEASMLNKDLFFYLKDQARYYKTKILFVGDKLQLPPVQEDKSLALEREYLDGISYLLEPVRQSLKNPLSLLLLALRCDIDFCDYNFKLVVDNIYNFEKFDKIAHIESQLEHNARGIFKFIRETLPTYINESEGYRFTKNSSKVVDEAIAAFATDEFANNPFHAKYIAYNNVVVEQQATNIRNALAGTQEAILINDLLTAYTNIVTYPDMQAVITNSEDYKVIDKVDATSLDGIRGWNVILESIRDKRIVARFIVNPNDYSNFITNYRPYFNEAKSKNKWAPYYKWKNDIMILNNLNKKHNDRSLPSQDLGYIFGCTVHKSQGSTYDKVFVNGENIGAAYSQGIKKIYAQHQRQATEAEKTHLAFLCRRLMYVALSRAKSNAVINL